MSNKWNKNESVLTYTETITTEISEPSSFDEAFPNYYDDDKDFGILPKIIKGWMKLTET